MSWRDYEFNEPCNGLPINNMDNWDKDNGRNQIPRTNYLEYGTVWAQRFLESDCIHFLYSGTYCTVVNLKQELLYVLYSLSRYCSS